MITGIINLTSLLAICDASKPIIKCIYPQSTTLLRHEIQLDIYWVKRNQALDLQYPSYGICDNNI